MLVKEVMSTPPDTCRAATQLGQAAKTMAQHNRGCLAVVDERGHLIGLVTDRDVALTVANRHQSPWQIPVREAMTNRIVSCGPDDPIESALAMFADTGVRRLPVADIAGHVKGMLSVDDLVLHCGRAGLSEQSVVQMLRSVYRAETGMTTAG